MRRAGKSRETHRICTQPVEVGGEGVEEAFFGLSRCLRPRREGLRNGRHLVHAVGDVVLHVLDVCGGQEGEVHCAAFADRDAARLFNLFPDVLLRQRR